MKRLVLVLTLGACLALPAVALAAISVAGSSGLVVTNSGCADKVGGSYAYITCTTGHSTVVQWSTPYSRSHVSVRGNCSHSGHFSVVRYWRASGRDRVNVKFWGPNTCTISSVVFS